MPSGPTVTLPAAGGTSITTVPGAIPSSASVSLSSTVRGLLTLPSSTVYASSTATGGSFTGLTWIATVAGSEVPPPTSSTV